jgi:hypothetical protein
MSQPFTNAGSPEVCHPRLTLRSAAADGPADRPYQKHPSTPQWLLSRGASRTDPHFHRLQSLTIFLNFLETPHSNGYF